MTSTRTPWKTRSRPSRPARTTRRAPADDYTNLIKKYLGTYAYSYVFDGQAGYLDYALSSATLTDQVTAAAEWHINADEADVLDYDLTFKSPGEQALYEPAAYRISDHDSVLVGLDLLGPPATISVTAGDNQSTTVDTDFGTQLSLTVLDSANQPVPNVTVTFAGPALGASASIVEAGPYTTDSDGNLTVTAHANSTAGAYDFVATAGDASATFHLTNLWQGTAQLSAGGSSCAAFANSTSTPLSQITYTVNKDKINGLSEGTISYWVRVVAPAGNNSLTIDQSVTTGNFATLFALSGGSNVFRADCTAGLKAVITQSSVNASSGTISVTFTAPVAGTYYLGIKLSSSPFKGLAQPTPTTVSYRFSTQLVADTTRNSRSGDAVRPCNKAGARWSTRAPGGIGGTGRRGVRPVRRRLTCREAPASRFLEPAWFFLCWTDYDQPEGHVAQNNSPGCVNSIKSTVRARVRVVIRGKQPHHGARMTARLSQLAPLLLALTSLLLLAACGNGGSGPGY